MSLKKSSEYLQEIIDNDNLNSKYRKVSDVTRAYKGLALESLINKVCKG